MSLFNLLAIALTVTFVTTAHAEKPTEEMAMVVRAILRTDVSKTLNERGTTDLDDITIDRGENLINKYVLKFARHCHCSPATSTATIIEDMRPITYDGPPTYEATVETTDSLKK